jgi:hypothetical protein
MLAAIQPRTFFSSRLLSKNLQIRTHNTITLLVVVYGHEIWFLALREEHRLRVCEKRALRRIFGLKSVEEAEGLERTE